MPFSHSNKTIISIVGPTATGKTKLAVSLAQHLNTCILSCDSRQCYKELRIITAKPTPLEQGGIEHYFVDSHSIHQAITVKDYTIYAQQILKKKFEQHNTIILVGGTGLFWTALRYGLDDIPPIPIELRQAIKEDYTKNGLDWLRSTLFQEDKLFSQTGECSNPQRMMRALEVMRHTKQSIKTWQKGKQKIILPYRTIDIGLKFENATNRHTTITERTNNMLKQGAEAEVNALRQYASLNALQTVGFKEWLPYDIGKVDYEKVASAIIKNTTYYAKRQMTWFKRYKSIQWFDRNTSQQEIIHYLKM